MKSVSLSYIKDASEIKCGHVILHGTTSKTYRNRALFIPKYGWVPCSIKLTNNFTTNPKELMVVESEPGDSYIPVTSPIWVTRSNIVRTFTL